MEILGPNILKVAKLEKHGFKQGFLPKEVD